MTSRLALTLLFGCAACAAPPESDSDKNRKEDLDVLLPGRPGGGTTTPPGDPGSNDPGSSACDESCDNACDGITACVPSAPPSSLPSKQWVNDFLLVDYEYWPYAGGNPSYPDDIGWGYFAGSPPAQSCMAEAYDDLVEILQTDPPAELLDLKDKKDVYAFYMWNNDYTGAATDGMAPVQYQHLWLYTTQNGGYLIKWISETNRDGKCVLPTREDLQKFAAGCLLSHPKCDKE